MAGTRTRLDPGIRREQILAAAREVFVADDYARASMEAVAARAGVTTGLVNHYFGTKRDLYLAVIADLAAGLPEMVETDVPDLPLEELVALNMGRFLDQFEGNFDVLSMLLKTEGGLGRDPEVAQIMAEAREGIVRRMAFNHAGGEEPSPELLLALRVFGGAAEAAAAEWLRNERASREDVERLLTRTLLALVGDLSRR